MLNNGFNNYTAISNTLDCSIRIVGSRIKNGCKMSLIVKFVQPQALTFLCQKSINLIDILAYSLTVTRILKTALCHCVMKRNSVNLYQDLFAVSIIGVVNGYEFID